MGAWDCPVGRIRLAKRPGQGPVHARHPGNTYLSLLFFLPRTDASDRFQLGILRAFASIFATFFLLARILRALVVPGAAAYKSISSRSIMVTTPSSSLT